MRHNDRLEDELVRFHRRSVRVPFTSDLWPGVVLALASQCLAAETGAMPKSANPVSARKPSERKTPERKTRPMTLAEVRGFLEALARANPAPKSELDYTDP